MMPQLAGVLTPSDLIDDIDIVFGEYDEFSKLLKFIRIWVEIKYVSELLCEILGLNDFISTSRKFVGFLLVQ